MQMPLELTRAHAKSTRIRRIQCQNGLFLEVLCDGSLQGAKHGTTDYGVFHLYSVGPNTVVIRNIITGLYLSTEKSVLTTKEFFGDDCLFQEILSEKYYVYYTSMRNHQNKSMAVCLESNGKSSLQYLSDDVSSCVFPGILFKTLLLPEHQYTHFYVMARSLDS